MPLKEFSCKAHGNFESYSAQCPHGCPARFVKQEIRTAPAYRSAGTKFTDSTLRTLAADYGLTNLKNDKDSSSVMASLRKGEDINTPRWSKVGTDIAGALGSIGAQPENNYGAYAAQQARVRLSSATIVGRHRA